MEIPGTGHLKWNRPNTVKNNRFCFLERATPPANISLKRSFWNIIAGNFPQLFLPKCLLLLCEGKAWALFPFSGVTFSPYLSKSWGLELEGSQAMVLQLIHFMKVKGNRKTVLEGRNACHPRVRGICPPWRDRVPILLCLSKIRGGDGYF